MKKRKSLSKHSTADGMPVLSSPWLGPPPQRFRYDMRIYAFNMQHKFCNKVRKGDGLNPISVIKKKYRDVLFEDHRAVAPFYWAVRPVWGLTVESVWDVFVQFSLAYKTKLIWTVSPNHTCPSTQIENVPKTIGSGLSTL